MNKVVLVGNTCNDIEVRKTQSGKSVCEFALAINENYGGENRTDFVDVQAWEKTAENLAKFVSKGSKLLVEGKIRTSTYQNQDGKKMKRTVVVASNFEFMQTKQTIQQPQPIQAPTPQPMAQPQQIYTAPQQEPTIEMDELPFY